MVDVPKIELVRNKSLRQQIADHVRRQIHDGTLAPETRLPAAQQLAAEWGTDQATVHHALTRLVKEGLLERTPKVGTFVRRRPEKLTRVGVYHSSDLWSPGGPRFQQALHVAIQTEWLRRGVEVDSWIDPRPTTPDMAPWPALERAVRERRIEALIVPSVDEPHYAWLSRLPLPSAFLSSGNHSNAVGLDRTSFYRLAVETLAGQGCQSVAVLPCITPEQPHRDGTRHDFTRALDALADAAADNRLTLRDDWIFIAPFLPTQAAVQRFGYEKTHELWRRSKRPQGLIVGDDVAATGVISALLELGVRVPEDLKLVIYKNSAVDIFCPLPATFIEISTDAIAQALIDQALKQRRGEGVEKVVIPYQRIEAGGHAARNRQSARTRAAAASCASQPQDRGRRQAG